MTIPPIGQHPVAAGILPAGGEASRLEEWNKRQAAVSQAGVTSTSPNIPT